MLFLCVLYMCICLDFVVSGLCVVPFGGGGACQFVKVRPPLPPQSVRRVALVAFNPAVHNKPVLTADLLDSLLPICRVLVVYLTLRQGGRKQY